MSAKRKETEAPGNQHYLNGKGYTFWYDKARGFEPRIVRRAGGEHHVLMKSSPDDTVVKQSGGIARPRDVTIYANDLIFRFYSSRMDQILGKEGWVGNWWIEEGIARVLFNRAEDRGKRLSTVAMDHLLIPHHWNNCSHIVKARVVSTCRAFSGSGTAVPPDTADPKQDDAGDPPRRLPRANRIVDKPEKVERLYANTPADDVSQLYIPGPCDKNDPPQEVARFKRMFRILGQCRTENATAAFFEN